jgi:hypothetical protein
MFRAVIPVAELSSVLSKEKPRYLSKSFPKMSQTDPVSTVIEIVRDEQGQWKTGFYRAAEGPLEFENHLRAF